MVLTELIPVLQLATGPVILISGVGLVLLSMTNRYGRVIDRARHVVDSIRREQSGPSARLTGQLAILLRRARLLRLSIIAATLSLLMAALLIIALFLAALLQFEGAGLMIVFFVAGMLALIVSLVLLIGDVNLSLAALDLEADDSDIGGDAK
jgi:hypothetical protein